MTSGRRSKVNPSDRSTSHYKLELQPDDRKGPSFDEDDDELYSGEDDSDEQKEEQKSDVQV